MRTWAALPSYGCGATAAAGRSSAVPSLLVEPGRYLVGDAGILRAEVLLVSRKSRHARRRWVYLDAGRFNGLPETAGERIHYRVRTPHDGTPCESVILAGSDLRPRSKLPDKRATSVASLAYCAS